MDKQYVRDESFKVLVVDDSVNTLDVVQRQLFHEGYYVYGCTSIQNAVQFLAQSTIDIVITDLVFPGESGMDLVKHVRDNHTDAEVMIITGYPCIEGAVQAIKDGAAEYLVKPFTDVELISTVNCIAEKLIRRRAVHKSDVTAKSYGIIGGSPEMQNVFQRMQKAAATAATVLISGESGTGKELVARAIHYNSARRSKPFVTVNCTAIPDTLIESELFGHVKGAFTGAGYARNGFFQIADKGTIFLDEIGDASLQMQGKLLRAIHNKEIRPVGSDRSFHLDTRIIAATHKDLKSLVLQGFFREDLYYRLDVIDIPVPPLRQRGRDILLLVNHFTAKVSGELNILPPSYTDNTLNAFRKYPWPGNIRELENLIQKLVVIVDGDTIRTSDLPEAMRFSKHYASPLNLTLRQVVAKHITDVLAYTGGNKTKAAEILGIDRKTLRSKLQAIHETKPFFP